MPAGRKIVFVPLPDEYRAARLPRVQVSGLSLVVRRQILLFILTL